jgi:ribose transport system substrate-binding protein
MRQAFRRFGWPMLAVACVVLAGCPTSNPPATGRGPAGNGDAAAGQARRIVLLTNGNSPFWDAARAGMQDAERDFDLKAAGLTAVMDVNDGTAQGQLDKLRQFASQGDVAAVGVSAIDSENVAIADELRKLREKGVHTVTIDSDFDPKLRDARFAYLGTDNLAGGEALGITARELRPEGGEYVTFVGITGAQNAKERVGGFAVGAGEKFKSLDNMGDDMDRTRARENVRNAIRSHPKLNTVVGIWSYNAPAIVDVVEELQAGDRLTVVAFDAEPLAIQQMGQGQIDAMVVQNPYMMGYAGVRLLKALVEDDQATVAEMLPNQGQEEGDIYDTGLKLPEFQDWLKKYNLTGS